MTDDEETIEDTIERVREAKRSVEDDARKEAVERQHDEGKMTARERVEYLCDDGSFDEIGQLAAPAPTTPETFDWEREDAPADGIVTGVGEVDGTPVAVASTDFTVKGGSIGHAGGRKVDRVSDLALENGYRSSCSTTVVDTEYRKAWTRVLSRAATPASQQTGDDVGVGATGLSYHGSGLRRRHKLRCSLRLRSHRRGHGHDGRRGTFARQGGSRYRHDEAGVGRRGDADLRDGHG